MASLCIDSYVNSTRAKLNEGLNPALSLHSVSSDWLVIAAQLSCSLLVCPF